MSPSFGRSWPIRPCVFGWRSSRRDRVSGHTRPASVCWCFPASVDTCCCWCVLLLEHVSSLWTVLYRKQTHARIECMVLLCLQHLWILCWNQFRCGLKLLFITSLFPRPVCLSKRTELRESHILMSSWPGPPGAFFLLWKWWFSLSLMCSNCVEAFGL